MLLALALSLSVHVHAQQFGPLSDATYEQVRSGFLLFPPALCPDVNRKYEELTEKLIALKTEIYKAANCTEEQKQVDAFTGLAEAGRKEFWDLVDKGRKAPLEPQEVAQITGYIEKLTKAGAALTDLILGSNCFKDESANINTVDVVASLIVEATAALSTVKGSYGPLITMAGRISASLLKSLDRIARHRQAYDFTKSDQRKVFIKTMCSYNGFRKEIDEISRVDDAIQDVRGYLEMLVNQHLDFIKVCPACKEIGVTMAEGYKNNEPFARWNRAALMEKFADQVKAADGAFAYGTQTVIDTRSWVWAQDELKRLDRLVSDIGDVERDRVVQLQDSIEEFFFVRWLPELIKYYRTQVNERMANLVKALARHEDWLHQTAYRWSPSQDPVAIVNMVFENRGNQLGRFRGVRERDHYQLSARAEINRLLGDLASAVLAIEKNCTFVLAARLRYEVTMHQQCSDQSMNKVYDLFWRLHQSSHKNSASVKAVFEVPSTGLLTWADQNNLKLPRTDAVWAANWLQTLTLQRELLWKTMQGKDFR